MNPTPSTFSKVLPYNWEAYIAVQLGGVHCSTNGRCTDTVLLGFPFFKAQSEEGTAIQMGGGGYCRTNWKLRTFSDRRVSNAALANAALVLSSKIGINIQDGGHCRNLSKKPCACIFTLSPCGNRCRFSGSEFFLRRCTHH